MPFLDLSAGRVHYSLEGQPGAAVVVLSNSLGTSLALWDQQATAFARHFRVLRYDTRGHGRTSVAAGPCSIERLAQDAIELLDHLHIQTAHFGGVSLGGMVGMSLAVRHPERIGKLILANTAAWLGPPELWTDRIETVRRLSLSAIADSVIQRWFTSGFCQRSPDVVERVKAMFLATPVDGYVACCEAIRDMDQRGDLPRIASPALVIGGRHDPATPPAGFRDLAASIRDAAYVELAAAHLSNVEAADAFSAVCLDFLSS